MGTASEIDYPSPLGLIDGLVMLVVFAAVFGFGLWSATRDPRKKQHPLRDDVIGWVGFAVVGIGSALLMGSRFAWHLETVVSFGRTGSIAAPVGIPFAICAIGGVAALVAALVAVKLGRPLGIRFPVIRPSRRQQPGR